MKSCYSQFYQKVLNFFLLQNVISIGAGEELVSEYRSVIFYHCGKPEWVETIKVRILKKVTFLTTLH